MLSGHEGLRRPQQQHELVLKPPPPRDGPGLAAWLGPQRNGFKAHVNSPLRLARLGHRQEPLWFKVLSDSCQRWNRERRTYLPRGLRRRRTLKSTALLFIYSRAATLEDKSEESLLQIWDVSCLFIFHPWQVLIYFFVSCAVFIFFANLFGYFSKLKKLPPCEEKSLKRSRYML